MRFLRYLVIGSIAYGIDFCCFISLLYLHISTIGPIFASISGKLVSSVFSLFAHRLFTFKNENTLKIYDQAWRYLALVLLSTQLSAFILLIALHWISNPIVAKLATDGFCIFISYWMSKVWIFARKHNNTEHLSSQLLGP